MTKISVNQLGYRPHDIKKAVVPQTANTFQIMRVSDEKIVFNGTAGEAVFDAASEEAVRAADFSSFMEKGEYIIITDEEKSYPFTISDNPYSALRTALLKMFDYQKCGVDIDCGIWSHSACHTSQATVYGSDKNLDVSGGWHDAGDYGRYIVPAAKSVADLLLAHELSPNPDPRLLDTVWFEIEWMLKMQDAETGGVYHKVTCRLFDALDEMPQDEHGELILSPISPTATADFCASMALASRFYPDKKDVLLDAAKRAWNWCAANPNAPNFKNPPDIKTGEYGDRSDKDERFWAACELFTATGEEEYHDAVKATLSLEPEFITFPNGHSFQLPHAGFGWGFVNGYGLASYIYHAGEKADASLLAAMKDKFVSACNDIMNKYKNDSYGVSLGERYMWGSMGVAGNNAMTLLLGSSINGDANSVHTSISTSYVEAALEHFHYILGRNPLSQSYITGFGSNAPKNPHHRPSVAAGSAVPGMVVGGPNMNTQQDHALADHCKSFNAKLPPPRCYVDHKDSFSANEITIYWNSPVYFIAAVLGF